MEEEYKNIEELIKENLSTEEWEDTQELINELKNVRSRSYFTKEEFLKMAMWKSGRPKRWYLSNSEDEIIKISKKVFSTNYDKRKIELLTRLEGVQIPTASAILMLTDPQNYGVIDIRVWQVLYLYGSVKVNPKGKHFRFNNWYNYLMKIRYFADKFKVKARDIERTLFSYHFKIQKGKLYD
ncbi:MAG: hypothetical protein KAU01_07035 [Candidatus Cloacimonetes bacterium]|nr:hypothetical protein [Candidatus Cloacimonadota bacterium]